MKETKRERFYRVAAARVNKIIKMMRLLGNCSGKNAYQYDLKQVDQIFMTLQTELDAARQRFRFGAKRFSLSEQYNLNQEIMANPHISLELPDHRSLTAVAFKQGEYPSVNIYLNSENEPPLLICFAEFNGERDAGFELCIGAYQSDDDDTKYYASYRAERRESK